MLRSLTRVCVLACGLGCLFNGNVLAQQHCDWQQAVANPRYQIDYRELAAEWQLHPSDDGSITIRYQGYADPAGALLKVVARSAALKADLVRFED